MFGLSKMYQERERLYQRAIRLEEKAGNQRTAVKKQVLEAMSSTKGLLVSFGLGLTTQCDTATKARDSLLRSARTELIGLVSQYIAVKMHGHQSTEDQPTDKKPD